MLIGTSSPPSPVQTIKQVDQVRVLCGDGVQTGPVQTIKQVDQVCVRCRQRGEEDS